MVLIGACATAPETETKPVAAPVFYPSATTPRIQHLVRLAGKNAFSQQTSKLAAFVAGDDKGEDLKQVFGVDAYDGRIYVADFGRGGLAIFDMIKQDFNVFHGHGAGRFKAPVNLTIDVDGSKYVCDIGRDQILVYDREDRFVTAHGELGQFRPIDVAVSGNRLYVTDKIQRNIHVLDKLSGKALFTFPAKGDIEGQPMQPIGISAAPNGDVLVVDANNYKVQRFNAEGKWLSSVGAQGLRPGTFARPKGIALDKLGRLYVSDAAFQNVQIFNAEGRILMDFGQSDKMESLSLPTAVAINYADVALYKRYAAPKFDIEYLILVASNQGPAKVDVFGFGRMQGVDYPKDDEKPAATAKPAASATPAPQAKP
jgi:DNA-binding beta-propeller fold protein YncE